MEQAELVKKGGTGSTGVGQTLIPPVLPLADEPLAKGWHEERLIDDNGNEIFVRFKGEPSMDRYEYVRDYYNFKIGRLKPKADT